MVGRNWRPLALVTQLGFTVAASLVLSLLLGLWLDNHFGTGPLFVLVCSLVGILIGTFGVYRLVTQAIAEEIGRGKPGASAPAGGAGPASPGPSGGEADQGHGASAEEDRAQARDDWDERARKEDH